MTAKELSKGNPILPANPSRQEREKLKTVNFKNTNLLIVKVKHGLSQCINLLITCLIKKVEEETREQSNSALWFELRYGRITASRTFEVSRCKTSDGTLISLIPGGKIPDTPAMKRGRVLENEVRKTVESKNKKKKKYYAQMQLQMYLSQKKNCCFCIADPDFSQNKKVDIINIEFDPQYVENFINKLLNFWKINIYPLLYQSVE
ncbi:hypothetical protein SFRURICE_007245 [Spodoptera frugiperda]|nr:hypothetical protein SFRURICE_007245 [Spodoptera frugiperda]